MRFPSRCHPGDGRPAALGLLVVSFLCLFPGALSESRVEGQGGAGDQEAEDSGPSRLYWTDAGSDKIQRALLDGSEVEDVVAGPRQLRGLTLDLAGDRLYWADRGAGKIQRADLDGGGEQDLVTGLSHPRSLVVDAEAGRMYWTDSGTDKIQRSDLDGSGVEDLVTDGLQTPLGLALDADAGWLYWTDWGTDKIQRARLDGSGVEDLVTGLHTPRGLALDLGAGRMYWTDSGTDKIQRAHLDGSDMEDLVTGLRLPRALALDAEAGQIYWTDAATGQIQCANLDGSDVRDLVTGLRDPRGLALALTGTPNRPPVVAPMADRTLAAGDTLTLPLTGHDPDGDDLTWQARSADEKVAAAAVRADSLRLVARAPGRAAIEVTARDPGGRTGTERFTVTVPANRPPEAVARLYWTESGRGRIRHAHLDGSGVEDLVTGLSQPRGLALDAAGGRLYWTDPRADKIQRASLDGSLIEDLVTTGLEAPSGLALDPAAGRLYWTDYGTDRVQRAGLDGSGVEALVTTGLRQPQGLALGAGRLYWTDAGADRIQAADLDGAGVRNLVTTGLQSPQDIALDTLGGYLYWADFGTDKIQRAPLDGSPVQDLVTEGLRAPQGMALDAAAGRIYWTDTGTGKIQRARLDGVGVEDLIAEGLDTPYDLAVGAGLPARRVRVGDEPDTLALAGRFRDPEGGPLSYHAVSADMAVAAAEVAGARITITAVAAGRTSIAVTARDPEGLRATLPLAVQVLPRPNRPPTLLPLADLTATAGDTLTLGIQATDPDGDRLRYTASAADSAIARASAVDSVMTLRPKAAGETTIAVTVRDDSLEAAGSFGLTVEWPNRAPVAGDLPDRQVFLGDEARVPLAKVFSDPDGDRLGYTAASKNPAVAAAEAARDTLTITPVAEGQAAIDVTATDPEGLQAAGTFTVTVKPKPPPGGGGGGGGFIPPPPPPPPPANNQAPTFDDGTSTARTVLESAPARQGIQHPVRATDPEGHPLTYRLAGPDADHFTVDRSRGQLRTRTGVAYDYETTDRYSVTLHAEDPYGGTDAINVTVHVADVDEPPQAPARPRVEPASSTSLTVTWDEPVNTGPDVNDYDLQYRKSGSFLPWPHTGPGATTTIPDLDLNTRYEVQVRATNDEGTGAWSASGFGSTGANQRPVFEESAPTRSLDENTPPNRNIGTPVRATDPELSPITYRLAGRDADSFTLDETRGQLRTRPGVTYDFETRSRYSVTVEATDEPGGRATITVTIELTDDDNERPDTPDKPSVTASTLNSLSIRWTAPANTGPDVNDYDVHYSEDGGAFTDWPHVGPGTTTTITGLKANTPYEVQVLARSDEGESLWSESVDVRTIANRAPTFTEGTSTTRTLAENTTGTTDIGNPITASDGDGGTLTYHLEGTDRASFSLDGNQLQTIAGVAYDYEEKSSYVVIVRVQDGQGGSNTIEVAINLIDRQEPPETPAAPRVIPASSTSLTVTWDEPANTGPDIDDYDIQYREGDSGGFTSWTHNGPELTATITGRSPGTSYEVQVLARNAEGTSDWSPSGTGSTHPNQPPVFTDGSSTTRSFAENTTGVQNIGDPLSATDPEGTPLTYSLEGTDADAFTINSRSGQLRTKSDQTYNYEAKPRYVVSVKATDGHSGERTITILINLNDVNEPPSFTSDATFETEENNRSIGRVDAVDVDNGDGITGYTLTGGADQDQFEINSAGALTFKEAPDFEDPADSGRNNEYIVEVTATGGTETQEQTTTQTITVTVENADEPPGKPDLPTVSNETENSLTVSWDEPSNTGPPITDYNVQYREGSSGAFTAAAHDGTGRTTTIANLESDTSYEIQVQATSDEGTSQWSPSGNGRTGANQAPTFTEGSSTTRRLVENTTGAHNIGNPITASDGDGGTLTYHLEGTDRASFSLDGNQLQTQSGETYDYEEKSSYVVIVRVQDGQGGSNTIEVAINLIDRQEPPETPSAPRVIPASSTSLTVTWDEPTNTGPDIDDYDIQYREGDSGGFTSWTHNGPELTATITGRSPGTSYEVQVRARNDEGASLWSPSGRSCSEGGDAPTPVEVEVTAVPIVVASTTDEYFVLYVRHDLDGTEVEIPVLVKKGEAGTTTLAENVAALPKERYRVEKYLLADPADVDGDCIDDITELDDLGSLNPVNAAGSVDLNDGAVALPDRATFETLSYGFGARTYLKFVLLGFNTENPRVYFLNATTHPGHPGFTNTLYALGIEEDGADYVYNGLITYHRDIRSDNGGLGVYTFWIYGIKPFSHVDLIHTLLAASMPVLEQDLAYNLSNYEILAIQDDLPLYEASRINVMFDRDLAPESDFIPLNQAIGYGLLRHMDTDDRPNPRDVVIYEALPNNLPRVAGIITTMPQTPLSHVNLRAVQDGAPNAFVRGALDDPQISALIGKHVRYTVSEDGYTIRAVTKEEIDNHYASSRPAQPQTPERDLSVTEITPLSDIGFDDWDAFGVKATNVAVLGTLGFPEGTVPDGFAIPFYFYDEFMKHNDFYTRIETMLADEDFQTDFQAQADSLKKLRKAIEDAETPDWIVSAIETMNESFSAGINRRYRSSTNNEDLPGFNGAGLYDSKSQKPSEDERDLAKSLKEVYASLWNFRAFIERDFHRVDHLSAAMGVLVHPSYRDELVNGVAVSFDPVSGREGRYYVNSQVGEDLVTNPDAHSIPEELLLRRIRLSNSVSVEVLATSNQVSPGELLMSGTQIHQLGQHLIVIHEEFKELYDPGPDEPFAMEIEFKITSDNILAIKQGIVPILVEIAQAPIVTFDTRNPQEASYR